MYTAHPLWGTEILVPPSWTGDDLLHLPDDGTKNELYEGILVREEMTSFGHGSFCQKLGGFLAIYAMQTGFPNTVVQNVLFDLTPMGAARRTILAPDLAVMRRKMPPTFAVLTDVPLIAVEVFSPSQTKAEMYTKANFYRGVGVDEVWLIDPSDATIEVWSSSGQVVIPDPQPVTTPLLPGFHFTYTDLVS